MDSSSGDEYALLPRPLSLVCPHPLLSSVSPHPRLSLVYRPYSLNPTPIPPFRYGVSAVTVLPCTPLVPACPARHRAWSLPTTTTHRDPSDCHHSSRRWRTAAPAAATNVQGLRHGSPVNVPENRGAEARKTILRVPDRRIWPAAHVSEDLRDGAV